ncbi:MAG: four helix bundle protein [Planctomycetota bacterium]|jgi:four helix bundle protein
MGKWSCNPEIENLEIYRLAEEISDLVWEEVDRWSPFQKSSMGTQVVKAADSIGSNISEAYGRYHNRDKLNFLYYSRGSLFETDTRWRKAFRRNVVSQEVFSDVAVKIEKMAPKLNRFISVKRGGSGKLSDDVVSYRIDDPGIDAPDTGWG